MEGAASLDHDRVLEQHVFAAQLGEVGDPLAEQHGYEAPATSSTSPRSSACWMTLALAIVTSLSPAISRALAIAASTPSTNVVLGHRSAAFAGALWVTTTAAAPLGWVSFQPLATSTERSWLACFGVVNRFAFVQLRGYFGVLIPRGLMSLKLHF